MVTHKYAVGDRVTVLPDRTNANMRPGVYTITKALPVTGRGIQYRAKNVMDSHERVLDEAQLKAIPPVSAGEAFGRGNR
ncbi:MAG: hypothetical protein JOZ58_24030 [Acetobacteraceae bacterium]|nr:hypothetical protein [Acetobacteraceae bacterium]MBV8578087.1 hypothetical protein [Acetobacteraceae bacterium]